MTRNQNAFLGVLRACEGTAGPDGYRTLFGGELFDAPPWEHPHKSVSASGYTSTAAGAYQALYSTWQDFIKARGPHDFSPAAQDEFALWCIDRRGATADVEAGRLEHAIAKCCKEWASLPGAPYGQPTRTLQFCLEHYLANGGQLAAEQGPAPIGTIEPTFTIGSADNSNTQPTGGPVPFVPIMLSLLPSLLNLFAPRAQAALQKVTAQPPDVVQQFVQSLFDKLGQLTGTTDPIQATAAITANPDPTKVGDLQEHALDYMDKLGPILDKLAGYDATTWAAEEGSKDAAAARTAKLIDQPLWSNPTFIVSMLVLLMIALLGASVVFMPLWTADNRTQLLQSFLMALTGILGFWIGSSRSSSAKDVLIGQMAQQAGKQ